MKNTKEKSLKEVFLDDLSKHNPYVRGILAGQEYLVTNRILYIGSTKDKDTPLKTMKGYEGNPGLTFQAVAPENMIFNEVEISFAIFNKARDRKFLPVGSILLDSEEEEIQLKFKPLIREYAFPLVAPRHIENEKTKLFIGASKTSSILLRIQRGTSMLIMPFGANPTPRQVKFNYHGLVVTPVNWSDELSAYTKLEKEEIMPKLNLPPLSTVAKDVSNSAPAVDDLQTKEDAEAMLAEIAEEAEKQKAAVEETPAPVHTEPKEAPVEEAAESESTERKRRKNKPKGTNMDLTPVIEACGAAVPDDVTAEDALKEIRQLRDLVKVAVCRLTNLSVSVIDKSAKANATLDTLRATLGLK